MQLKRKGETQLVRFGKRCPVLTFHSFFSGSGVLSRGPELRLANDDHGHVP